MSEIYSYPKEMKKLRACLGCQLVKTEDQFNKDGCENCSPDDLRMTQNFKGIIAITNPKFSWCAKWLHKNNVIPGFYCIDIISDEQEDMDVYDREDYQEEAD